MIERKAQSAGSLAGRDGSDAAGTVWIELERAAGEGVATTLPPDTTIATQARTGGWEAMCPSSAKLTIRTHRMELWLNPLLELMLQPLIAYRLHP